MSKSIYLEEPFSVFNEQKQFDFFKVVLNRLRYVNQNRTFSSLKKKILSGEDKILHNSVSARGNNIFEYFMYRKNNYYFKQDQI